MRRPLFVRLLTIAFVIVAGGLLLAFRRAPDLGGVWRVDLPRAGDVTLRTYLLLRQSGRALAGNVIINGSVESAAREARIENKEAVFSDNWGIQYRARREGDRLIVKIKHGEKPAEEAIAIRVPEAETKPPRILPLPTLEAVPANGLARTPPMGWSSWNHFAENIDQRTVEEIADALVSSGLAAAGYVYVNIDDGWSGGRDESGNMVSNSKFPDMKALADYVHARGLKLGIYSSPGPKTCAGYEGSYGQEERDAQTFAAWGIDYLKYDWCSAARVYSDAELRAAYQKMGQALARSGRPIVYSVCEYGLGEVWKWGPLVGGNLWRTTNDIRDNWASVSEIGFSQSQLAPFAKPGNWNDPDMLVVGNGGMSATEYRSHFSLWALLAAPLMAGNDVRKMTPETLKILGNREVIAIDQDPLGRQGERVAARDGVEIWTKPLQDGGVAVGIFNRSEAAKTGTFSWQEIGRSKPPEVIRDLWAHRDLTPQASGYSVSVPAHGVALLRVK